MHKAVTAENCTQNVAGQHRATDAKSTAATEAKTGAGKSSQEQLAPHSSPKRHPAEDRQAREDNSAQVSEPPQQLAQDDLAVKKRSCEQEFQGVAFLFLSNGTGHVGGSHGDDKGGLDRESRHH